MVKHDHTIAHLHTVYCKRSHVAALTAVVDPCVIKQYLNRKTGPLQWSLSTRDKLAFVREVLPGK